MAELVGTDLRRYVFVQSSMLGVSLFAPNLDGADLHGITLRRANLKGAKMAEADVRDGCLFLQSENGGYQPMGDDTSCRDEATIARANLRGANLKSADIRFANLRHPIWRTLFFWMRFNGRRFSRRQRFQTIRLAANFSTARTGRALGLSVYRARSLQPGLGYPPFPGLSRQSLFPIAEFRLKHTELETRRHV